MQFYIKKEERLCPPVIIPPENIAEVQKQVVVEEDINLAEIAGRDNYPPEIVAVPVEEDIEKSVSQAGSKKL